jgi:hypothetical protein
MKIRQYETRKAEKVTTSYCQRKWESREPNTIESHVKVKSNAGVMSGCRVNTVTVQGRIRNDERRYQLHTTI